MILILGGTAAYFLPLEELLGPLRRVDLETPHGAAFPIFLLKRYGERVAFASRHGLGRLEVSPPFVNARANIWAAHALGVTRIISWNGVGAINPLLEVHDLLVLDGVLDFTKTRLRSFADDRTGTIYRAPTVDPCFDPALNVALYAAASRYDRQPTTDDELLTTDDEPLTTDDRQRTTDDGRRTTDNGRVFQKGIYACSEGPRLETAAEIRGFRRAGADVVGMTLVPEVFLARELGMAFASLTYVTNYATGVEPAHGAPRFFGIEVGRRCLAVVLAASTAAL
jgi:5'-methylthioadenosine phosphorylase